MNKKKFILIPILLILILIVSFFIVFIHEMSPVDKNSEEIVKFTVEVGWGKNKIVSELEKSGLIRNDFFAKLVLKFSNKELYAGTYKLSKDLSTNEIINKISNQENIENESISITFVEGKRLVSYIKQICDTFGFNEEETINKLSDKDYLNSLIKKYWFITDDIYNEEIYYPLEGYLYPDTYEFKKNSTLEEVIDKMLINMDRKLTDYKDEINLSNYSIHEFLTLASIVELEGVNSLDRAGVAGVFYNRLNSGMTLGSDVTTYYAVKKDFSRDLTRNDLNSCNGYNTRGTCVDGLPVGPICGVSLSSIAASIEPESHNYYYFVADKNKKTYFSKDSVEHTKTVSKLKNEGLWYTY
ncbi:MAG: endolytic transglycosylase MltG [Bacilli bacterium]|nr:endolytic transglycosylase MltG [Bacilli bacterium]